MDDIKGNLDRGAGYVVTGFFTPNYRPVAERLVATLNALKIPFRVHPNLSQSLLYMPFHNHPAGLKRRFRSHKLFGYPLPFFRTQVRHISTSPGLYSGKFVRTAASMMDVRLDPEKQFGGGLNPALERYAASFDSYIHSPDGGLVLADLGRDWLAQRGIKKRVVDGATSWETAAFRS